MYFHVDELLLAGASYHIDGAGVPQRLMPENDAMNAAHAESEWRKRTRAERAQLARSEAWKAEKARLDARRRRLDHRVTEATRGAAMAERKALRARFTINAERADLALRELEHQR